MKSLFGKIISILLSIFVPFISLTPAMPGAPDPARPKKAAVQEQEERAEEELELAQDEAAPTIIVTENNAQAEAEADAEAEIGAAEEGATINGIDRAEAQAEGNTAIKEWDISATDEDDVQMYYFAEGDDSFLDNFKAAVRAAFVPMTVYAAEEEEEPALIEGDDEIENVQRYTNGTVYITGIGATQPFLAVKWLDYDKFVPFYERWSAENGFKTYQSYIKYSNIDENGEFIDDRAYVSLEEAFNDPEYNFTSYEEMFEVYLPYAFIDVVLDVPNFWRTYGKYEPTKIVFDEGVENVSYAAFAFFSSITSVEFYGDIEEIGVGAFAGTGLTEVRIPDSVTDIEASAFSTCENLNKVLIPASVETIGAEAFYDIADNAKIYCETYEVALRVAGENYGQTISEYDEELDEYVNTPVELDQNVFNQARMDNVIVDETLFARAAE